MPKRTITTRRNKATDAATDAATVLADACAALPVAGTTETLGEIIAAATATDAATDAATATDAAPVAPLTFNAEFDAGTIAAQFPDATPNAVATPATPDAKAEFLNRKAAATASVLPLYAGASLAVHRSDRQPADSKYIERVASPVQKIGPNGPTPRDNSFMLAVYDFFVAYRGSDFSGGFNPAQFGADLGTTSRAASVGYLSTDLSDIYLTDAGRVRGANLAAKRAKA